MAIHSFIPGTEAYILLIMSTIVCLYGIILLLKRWGHGSAYRFLIAWKKEVFRFGIWSVFKTLVLDVLYAGYGAGVNIVGSVIWSFSGLFFFLEGVSFSLSQQYLLV